MPASTATLQQLTARVAGENDKDATLHCTGFEAVPEEYRRAVKDIGVQAVRNAIVHGIEAPAGGSAAGKSTQGVVRLSFQDLGEAGYKLIVEDDGQGLSTERIKEVALKKGFITPERAADVGGEADLLAAVPGGIFHPGDGHEGCGPRCGHEPDRRTHQSNGRPGVGRHHPGKFTRLTMTLPREVKRADDTEAA
jgi:two-component system chemotaxis sensor kinase CheA